MAGGTMLVAAGLTLALAVSLGPADDADMCELGQIVTLSEMGRDICR